jgi:hypothetical protein
VSSPTPSNRSVTAKRMGNRGRTCRACEITSVLATDPG